MGGSNSKEINKVFTDIYREKVTSIISRNTTSVSNLLDASQVANVRVKCTGDVTFDCPVDQNIYGDMKVIVKVSQNNINELVSLFTSDLNNTNSQTMKQLMGFLSNIGDFSSIDVRNEITSRIKDIITNNVTLENISTIMNKIKLGQELNIYISGENCKIFGENCRFNQNIGVNFIADNVVTSLIDSVINDTNIQRLVNDNKQVTEIEKRGLDDLVNSLGKIFTSAIFIIGVVLAIMISFTKSILPTETLSEVAKKNPRLAVFTIIFLVLLVVFVLYLIIAYFFSFWPFNKEKVFWTCEKINNLHTGKCVPASKDQKYGFKTQEECMKSGKCDQYWGCEIKDEKPTGQCTQFQSAVLGPERSKEVCEEKVKNGLMCTNKYGCALSEDKQYYADPPSCTAYSDPTKGKWTSAQCQENIGQCKNSWKCVNRKCEKAEIGSGLGIYSSEQECNKLCGKN